MTHVQFPASMSGSSKLPVTLSIGDLMLSSGFHGYIYKSGMHSHRHTDKHKTKTFKLQKFKKVEQRANKGYRVLVWEDEKVQDLNSSDNVLVLSITKQYGKND